jgi:surfactin synthase thioesterase subunit
LSNKEKIIYQTNKDKVEEELHATKLQIGHRKDTFWEQFTHSFGQLIPLIMDKLTDIIFSNSPLRLLGNVITALLPGSDRNNRRLPASR